MLYYILYIIVHPYAYDVLCSQQYPHMKSYHTWLDYSLFTVMPWTQACTDGLVLKHYSKQDHACLMKIM